MTVTEPGRPDATGPGGAGPPADPTGPPVAAGARLDPDALAALEEERDHLARSLRDLEAEHAAGDLADDDLEALRDDYVVRMADVLRAIEAQQSPARGAPSKRRRTPRQRLAAVATVLGVAAFAVAASLLVARVAGNRTSQETLTGDIRGSTRDELANCLELAGSALRDSTSGPATGNGAGGGELLDAVKCYSEVLQRAPGNPEALTYRGWLLVRTGNPALQQQAADDLDRAVTADPTYPDARAFRAIVFFRLGEIEAARSELQVLDTLDAPPIIDRLLEQFGVRQGIADAAAPPTTPTPVPPSTKQG